MEWLQFVFNDSIMLTSLIQQGTCAVSWVILCHGSYRNKRDWMKFCLDAIVLALVLLAAFYTLKHICNGFNSIVWNGMLAAISALYVAVRSPYKWQVTLLLWCSMYAGFCCITMIAGQVQFLVTEFGAEPDFALVFHSILFLFAIPLAFYLRHFNFNDYTAIPQVGYLLVLAGDFSVLTLTLVEFPWIKSDHRIVITLLFSALCIFTLVLVGILAIHTMCKERAEILTLQTEKQRLQSERELASMNETSVEVLRCVRHDLKKQYAYMQILLESQRYDEVLQYFRQMSENVPVQLHYVDCGNRSINTVLNMEISKAKKENIKVEHQLVVPPKLPFSDDDLCAIIANLMDNAIEECRRLQEKRTENVGLRIEINPYMNYLYIMCSNTTNRERLNYWKGGLRTTKENEHLHGYGTQIVAKLAEKYDGHVEYKLKDGCFVAQCLLDMMREDAE